MTSLRPPPAWFAVTASTVLCALAGCGSSPAPGSDVATDIGVDAVSDGAPTRDGGGDAALVPGPPRVDPAAVHVRGRAFRDGRGRQLVFRGYNVKIPVLFDVTFDDGRAPTETFPPFTEVNWQQFEDLGFNAIRLPINWSGLEPHPQQYPEAFLRTLDETLAAAWRHGIYVLIDMHQDAYSKEIGEDGAPLWAIVPQPAMLLAGPYDDARRLSPAVTLAGENFWANRAATDGRPLQQAFVAAVQVIARRTLGNPAVLGFEAFNEPVVFSQDRLDPFHARFADGIHAVDGDAPVVFEPMATRNQADRAPLHATPWDHGAGAYAPHVYTGWFSVPDQMGWASEDPAVLVASVDAAEREAAAWATPLFVTEFGCDVSNAHGVLWVRTVLDQLDRVAASATAWAREPGGWGLYDGDAIRPDLARVVARAVPRAVAGDLLAIERPEPGRLRVRYRPTAATRGLPHEVSASPYSVRGVSASCNGAPVAFVRHAGRIEFVCDNDPATGEGFFDVTGTPLP